MASLSSVYNVLKMGGEISRLVANVDKLTATTPVELEEVHETIDRSLAAVNQTVLLGLNTVELALNLAGKSNEALAKVKIAEIYARTIDIPLRHKVARRNHDSSPGFIKYVEDGIVAPVVSLTRACCEFGIYGQKADMEKLYPSDSSTPVDPSASIFFDKALFPTKRKREDELESCSSALQPLKAAEVFTAYNCGSNALKKAGNTLSRMQALYNRFTQQAPAPAGVAGAGGVVVVAGVEVDPLNLVATPSIPEPLHNDRVFRRYICPITQLPIRNPVRDPNGITLYERTAILRELTIRPRSPMTHRPLTAAQLIEVPALQTLINRRLQFYQNWFAHIAAQMAEAPADHQAAADAENPQY